jgi:aspartyl-tRNA(Asn)/glutamyl-tRNA(Gln) amidotransferase subunit A
MVDIRAARLAHRFVSTHCQRVLIIVSPCCNFKCPAVQCGDGGTCKLPQSTGQGCSSRPAYIYCEVRAPRPPDPIPTAKMSDDVLALTCQALLDHYRAKTLSPVEVTRAALERIEALQPVYNAFAFIGAEQALDAARASEQRWLRGAPVGRVDGLPTTVKDLLLCRGWPTRRGSLTVAPDQPWDEDSASVARLREQGAVFLGKTTTPEFGWKGVTDSPLTGITRNPWNPALTPGGSSGGAAVAAAFGMGALHLATDGGGSIRIPAAMCGLFGFKPTFGVVPVHPHSPALTLWHQGPIARTVADAALMLNVISAPDARDFYAAPPFGIDFLAGLDDGIRGLRIGYSRAPGRAKVDAGVAAAVDAAATRFAALGAELEEIDLPLDDVMSIMQPMWAVALAVAIEPMSAARRALLDPPVRELAEPGLAMSALQYRAIERQREAFARRISGLHERFDLLLTPQLATTAFAAGHEVPPGSGLTRWWEWSPFTCAFNLTQQPAASVPCGFTAAGLPVGLQLVGRRFDDATVLRAARAYEAAHPFRLPAIPHRDAGK